MSAGITAYVGITLKDGYVLTDEDRTALQELGIKVHNNRYLYGCTLTGDCIRDIQRSPPPPQHQLIHLMNQLKRVRSEQLYAAFNDDFGIHVAKRPVIIARKR